MVLLPLLCVLAVVFVLTKRKAPIYEANTRIVIAPTPGSSVPGSELLQEILEGTERSDVGTQVQVLRSSELMQKALPRRILKQGTPQIAARPAASPKRKFPRLA